jgi:hypothetical protein
MTRKRTLVLWLLVALIAAYVDLVLWGRQMMDDSPYGYVQTLKSRIQAQSDDAVRVAAHEAVRPDALTWRIIDADGKVLR